MSEVQTSSNGSGEQSAPKVEEVIVVGSGPAGFTAGLYAARANLESAIAE